MIDQARVRVGQWKLSLVDSPLLLDVDEASSLALPAVEPEALVASLAGGAAFAFEAGVASSVETGWLRIELPTPELERRLARMRRAARAELSETGTHTLWVALGALVWIDGEATRRAPLALLPVELERASGGGLRLVAIENAALRVNDVLVEKLREAFDVILPVAEGPLTLASLFETARGIAVTRPGWSVEPSVRLGLYSLARVTVARDVAVLERTLAETPVVQQLATLDGVGGGAFAQPSIAAAEAVTRPRGTADLLAPLDADAGQLAAVAAAAAGATFVLAGAPGTGKSQTVANLIAHCVSAGKTVLFVGPSRATLDVVQQRLGAVGLGEFCLPLHTPEAARGAALAQLGRVLERAFRPASGALADDARLAELRTALDAHVAALHKVGPFGRSLYEVIGRLIELRATPRMALAEHDAVALDRATYERRRAAVADLAIAAIPVEPVATHPWRASTLEPAAFGASAEGRERAIVALDEMAGAVAELSAAVAEFVGLVPGLVARTRPQLAALGTLAALAAATPRPGAELLTNIRGGRTDEIAERIALIRAKGNGSIEVPRDPLTFLALATKHRMLADEVAEKFTDAVDEIDAPSLWAQLRKWGAISTFGMGPVRYLALRTVRAEVKAAGVPGELATDAAMLEALEAAIAERACRAALTAAAEPAKRWFGELAGDPLMLDLTKVEAAVSWAGELRKAFDAVEIVGGEAGRSAAWRALVAQVAATPSEGAADPVALARLASAVARWTPALAALSTAVGIDTAVLGAGDDHLLALRDRVDAMRGAVDALQGWVTFHAARHAALSVGVGAAVTAIERGDIGAEELAAAWECATLFAWAEAELAEAPALARFHGATHHAHVSAFADLDRGALALARARALVRFAERVPKPVVDPAAKDGGGEVGMLLAEVRRARMPAATPPPLRALLAQLPALLPRLAPCIVATPGTLAEMLDPSLPSFDVVVIDDAHQLSVATSLGALARGRAAVIVGDPWADDRRAERSLFASALDARLPRLELSWHYRSKHEDLIAFANARLGTGALQVLPAAFGASELGVSARKVDSERAEAELIVAEVMTRLRDPMQRGRSIGVVTVAPAQREVIEDLFDALRAADPALDAAFDPADPTGTGEPVVVRDLASLRAEERDVVFLSTALGDATLDERRFVRATAVAREHLVVVSSLSAEEAPGVLGELLAFARGRGGAARPTDDTPAASPVTAAIARALSERGWTLRHQVGCGMFTLDLAVVDPNDPERYVLAIELDGPAYAIATTARDRDRLRPQVLAQLGWRLHRIWSLDWWADPERELQRAHGAIVAAVAASRQRRSPMTVPPVMRTRAPRASGPIASGTGPIARPRANTPTEPVRVPAHVAPQLAAGSGPSPAVPLPAYDKPTTPTRVARGAIAIGPYTAAAIPAGRRTPDDLFAPRHQAELGKVVEQVLAAEAPMHIDLLARRVGGYFGIGRVTQRVGDQIRQVLLGRGKLGDEDNIVWRMDQDPNMVPSVRVAGHGGAGRREIEQVPLSELASAARIVVERAHGIATPDLIRDSARLLGFARITEAVIARVTVGVQLAIARELIRISDGKALMPA